MVFEIAGGHAAAKKRGCGRNAARHDLSAQNAVGQAFVVAERHA
jgi:hypothetical protein